MLSGVATLMRGRTCGIHVGACMVRDGLVMGDRNAPWSCRAACVIAEAGLWSCRLYLPLMRSEPGRAAEYMGR